MGGAGSRVDRHVWGAPFVDIALALATDRSAILPPLLERGSASRSRVWRIHLLVGGCPNEEGNRAQAWGREVMTHLATAHAPLAHGRIY